MTRRIPRVQWFVAQFLLVERRWSLIRFDTRADARSRALWMRRVSGSKVKVLRYELHQKATRVAW